VTLQLAQPVTWDAQGLVVAIAQDARTGEVLMVAYMNAAALHRTLATGAAHFWSRSRQELWEKGSTSGNRMHVQSIRGDCDGDALLLQVIPAGPACHTGQRSCFGTDEPALGTLALLEETVADRLAHPRPGSYVAGLAAAGPDRALQKIGEEATEVVLAGKGGDDRAFIAEMADLWFHTLIALKARGLVLADVARELAGRRR
jgi:phosphoribosyl-ATP pyrophosphohydrolase/phosphoribosyl-AMP cyclohydrolase